MMSASGLTVLIVDDEPPARRRLRMLLERHPDIEVVGEAGTGPEAVAAIHALRPIAVFLDVQMPDGDGFEVVRQVGADRMPIVVFATAYDEYALRAFEARALDYLLKPYDRERFDEVLARVRDQARREHDAAPRLLDLVAHLERRSDRLERLAVRTGSRIRLVDVEDVDAFEAEANYVRIHAGPSRYLLRATLGSLEAQLDPVRFLRVHRSVVVNVRRVLEVEPLSSGAYELVMHDGRSWRSGRTYRTQVEEAFGLRG